MKLSDLKDDKVRLKVIRIIQNKNICDALITLKDEGFDIKLILYNHIYSADGMDVVLNFLNKVDPE